MMNDEADMESRAPTLTADMEESDWLGSLGADIRSIATFFHDTAQPVVGGVASLVHQTALSVAAEIADWEREQQESSAFQALGDSISSTDDQGPMLLPWEVRKRSSDDGQEKKAIFVYEDEELMKDIMSLSSNESTFLEPFTSVADDNSDEQIFTLDDNRIRLIQRLFDADESLVFAHTRMSGRKGFNEVIFWRNYFFNCEKLRCTRNDQTLKQKGNAVDKEPELRILDDAHMSPSIDQLRSPEDPQAMKDDDSSFVRLPSAPNSLNTTISTKSLEDMVLVGSDSHLGK